MGNLFRCNNTECGRHPKGFVFEADKPICPKCGRANAPGRYGPHIHHLVYIHFVVMGDGPIYGAGGKQRIACQKFRDAMATKRGDDFTASGDPRVTTCPSCKTTPGWKALAACYPEIAAAAEVEGAIELQMKQVRDEQAATTVVVEGDVPKAEATEAAPETAPSPASVATVPTPKAMLTAEAASAVATEPAVAVP